MNYPTGSGYTNQIPLHEVGIENIGYRDLSCKVAVIKVKTSQIMCQRSDRGSRECQSRHRLERTCREKCSQENLQAQDSSSGLRSTVNPHNKLLYFFPCPQMPIKLPTESYSKSSFY